MPAPKGSQEVLQPLRPDAQGTSSVDMHRLALPLAFAAPTGLRPVKPAHCSAPLSGRSSPSKSRSASPHRQRPARHNQGVEDLAAALSAMLLPQLAAQLTSDLVNRALADAASAERAAVRAVQPAVSELRRLVAELREVGIEKEVKVRTAEAASIWQPSPGNSSQQQISPQDELLLKSSPHKCDMSTQADGSDFPTVAGVGSGDGEIIISVAAAPESRSTPDFPERSKWLSLPLGLADPPQDGSHGFSPVVSSRDNTSRGNVSPHQARQRMKLRSDSQSSLVTKQSNTSTALQSVHRLRQVDAELSSQTFLSRAFVVNFRRLLELQKIFAVLHELIRSTAIAALTLVAAGNRWQLGYSCIFVAILLCLYAFHAAHYDSMDISDYRQLVDLLEDDDGCSRNGRTIDNPNRLLKALAVSRRGRRRRSTATIASFGILCAVMWFVVVSIWADMDFYDWAEEMKDDFYATLLLVGTFMLGFIVAFDWIYWRETQCILPFYDAANGVPFDPHKHGIPRGYRWLGLPSMWFTSQEAYDDLRLWITRAQQHGGAELDSDDPRAVEETSVSRHGKIYPEEMAIFALDGGGCLLRNALLHAKLYSNRSRNFMTRIDTEDGTVRPIRKGEEPEELGVRLLLFDSSSREYLEPEEGYSEGQVHLLGRYGTDQSLPSLLGD